MNSSSANLLVFIVALSFLMFTHELGHFLIGKLFKIQAEEFGFGYPPRLLKLFNWGSTEVTLNWIPFGAFVRFKGEDDPNAEGGFYSANKWQRLGTLAAGPAMNILIGILLFTIVIAQSGYPNENVVQIAYVEPNSPAYTAGILANDEFVAIDGQDVASMNEVSSLIKANLGQPVEIEFLRDGQPVTISVVPRANPPEGQGAMGIVMQNPVIKYSFFEAIPQGTKMAWTQIKQVFQLPGMISRGEVSSEELRPLSPKGLYDVYAQVRENEQAYESQQPNLAFLNVAWFFGIISTALGYTNLLPIPALDGGRILFILPEIVLGKRVPSKYENAVHMVGYVALLGLMAFIFLRDFINPVVLP
ncbi:MAG: regulator of sigma protease [Chloroflexota bacterium]|nr:regulator of sigma protease [Chloroflexota bacterium]